MGDVGPAPRTGPCLSHSIAADGPGAHVPERVEVRRLGLGGDRDAVAEGDGDSRVGGHDADNVSSGVGTPADFELPRGPENDGLFHF